MLNVVLMTLSMCMAFLWIHGSFVDPVGLKSSRFGPFILIISSLLPTTCSDDLNLFFIIFIA